MDNQDIELNQWSDIGTQGNRVGQCSDATTGINACPDGGPYTDCDMLLPIMQSGKGSGSNATAFVTAFAVFHVTEGHTGNTAHTAHYVGTVTQAAGGQGAGVDLGSSNSGLIRLLKLVESDRDSARQGAHVAHAEPSDEPLAAIDIGTNSIHLVVARPTGNNRFEVIDREKEVVRLGSGSGDMKHLAPDAIERGLDALRRFQQVADSHGAEIVAVATARCAKPRTAASSCGARWTRPGVHVAVVSGAEEARLIRLGALQAVPAYDQRHLVIDIGGGSTEFVIGERDEVLGARSLKLGAIRLTERFRLAGAGEAQGARRMPSVHPVVPRARRPHGAHARLRAS